MSAIKQEIEDTPLQYLQRRRNAALEVSMRWRELIKDLDNAILILGTQEAPKPRKPLPKRKPPPTPKAELKSKPFKHIPFP